MGNSTTGPEDEDETVSEFLVAIFEDVRAAEKELSDSDTPYRRRAFVRTTFASVEGLIFTMKKVALAKPELFTTGALALLREEDFFLTNAGEVRTRPRFLRMAENLRFAFAAFMKFHGSTDTLAKDDGWAAFKKAVNIRNRVTHPRCEEDLELGDAEMQTVRYAAHWVAINVLMSVVKTMGSTAVAVVGLFLVGWGLKATADSAPRVPPTQAAETD